jgi:hypothetical protein
MSVVLLARQQRIRKNGSPALRGCCRSNRCRSRSDGRSTSPFTGVLISTKALPALTSGTPFVNPRTLFLNEGGVPMMHRRPPRPPVQWTPNMA